MLSGSRPFFPSDTFDLLNDRSRTRLHSPQLFQLPLTSMLDSSFKIFFPFGSTTSAIYSAVSAIIFSGYIVYDTDNLIKRFTYDQYIWASVTLYLDILNLFLTILRMLKQDN